MRWRHYFDSSTLSTFDLTVSPLYSGLWLPAFLSSLLHGSTSYLKLSYEFQKFRILIPLMMSSSSSNILTSHSPTLGKNFISPNKFDVLISEGSASEPNVVFDDSTGVSLAALGAVGKEKVSKLPEKNQSTPFYPYYALPPYAGVPPTYSYPPYAPPYYPPPPHQPATTGPSTAAGPLTPTTPEQSTDGRMLIAPEGDTFHPSKQPTHKIRDIIRSRFDTPYVSWKKVPKEVRKMWFRVFEEKYTRLRENHATSGEGSSNGSVEFLEYRMWSQAIGEIQYGRVYDLGSQAQAYEGMTSSTASNFASNSHESIHAQ
ncbi:hypothetical protein MA16_Dca007939 [Dendrobium catenatum]|uniref:Uncharacterized protein n=1 Tax=Dendrobium catenatum TaxID=906689 RepID=A0A2I0XJA8_9ASPA|nr:hypothetical protein MA16_Dca007939 [Dendrobium catenatum]